MTTRIIFLFILIFTYSYCFSQIEKSKEFYSNGQLKEKGKYLYYKTHEYKGLDCFSMIVKKKVGKWVYYYLDGRISKIENYSAKLNCDRNAEPDGIWQYWNQHDQLYRTELFRDGKLIESDIEIYKDSILVKKIMIRNGKIDKVLKFTVTEDTLSLLENGDFDLYKYRSSLMFNEGKDKIEELIPYWNTPNHSTPDYYNDFRKIKGISDNIIIDNTDRSFVGLILYHPTKEYSEYIQTAILKPLKAGKTYYFWITLCLSQNSGWSIDKFGAYFSDSSVTLNNTSLDQKYKPQLVFDKKLDQDHWITHCDSFVANGNENFLTIGRFYGIDDLIITKKNPKFQSGLDINASAYYLIDEVGLYENSNQSLCCMSNKEADNSNIEFELIDSVSIEDLITKKIILNNIQFEFDSITLLQESISELESLKMFLNKNPKINIQISGHTDDVGSIEYNVKLSELRAKAVCDWLISNGIDLNRLKFIGYGQEKPIVQNISETNRNKNRRVEFEIIENE